MIKEIVAIIVRAQKAGLKIKVEISEVGCELWIGDQFPQDLGYPNAVVQTVDELREYVESKISDNMRYLEGEVRRAQERLQQAKRKIGR